MYFYLQEKKYIFRFFKIKKVLNDFLNWSEVSMGFGFRESK